MTSEELIKIGQSLYGSHGWQTAMAAALDIDASTIRRWIYANHIPRTAELALQHLSKSSKAEKFHVLPVTLTVEHASL